MNPQWITAGIGLVQLGALALLWRMQRDHARLLAEMKEWVHREYMPRELADERYARRAENSGFLALSQHLPAKS